MNASNTMQRQQARIARPPMGDINGMVPPQAVELEKSVLGALMLDQDALFGTIDRLHEGLFYKMEHQVIFATIRNMVRNAHEVDLLTLVEELRKEGKLEQAGGAFYLSQLSSNVVSSAHIEYHIQILVEKYMQREVIRTSTENIRKAYDETCDPIQLLDDAQKSLMEVSEASFKRETLSLGSALAEAGKTLLSESDGDYSIPTGFVELDRYTSGFQPGTLIILAARPAMGKTACALTMARNIAVDFQKPVAFFSLEMTAVELVARLLSAEASIPANKLKKSANLTNEEKQRLYMNVQKLQNVPLYIDDTSGLDIFELRAKCRRMHMKYGIKVVFVDYLQLMTAAGEGMKNRNREQELSSISRQLKEMSKELQIPVVAMAQFNRKVDDRPMGIPILSDLRESGAIEQDADIVMALHRLWKYGVDVDEAGNSTENRATLRILKHRSGDTGVVDLQFEGKYVRFSNLPSGNPNAMPVNKIFDSKMNSDLDWDNSGGSLNV